MNRGFWDKPKKPILALAPMANVTDAAFRNIIARYGKPDIMWTEFVSVDGLLSAGREKLLVDLRYSEAERPIVAQIFGSDPEKFEAVAKMLAEMGFDGIDINMGCPDRAVMKQGAGGATIKDPKLAQEIIVATKRGAPHLPVSVKTRIGCNKVEIETWIPALLKADLAAITVHLRTVKEMSKVPAHWELMPEIMGIVNNHRTTSSVSEKSRYLTPGSLPPVEMETRPLILGNGDVMTLAEAEAKVAETGCDGVMIGRGIFGNPWLFNRSKQIISISERMRAMLEHTRLFEKMYCGISAKGGPAFGGKNFEVMKKHYKAYVNGFDGAKELRMQLMEAETSADVERIVYEHYPVLQKNPA
ncbi:MAG: tRNA-dihydrouridine synthase [Candidatus Doudnabacteria bacterium]|nr:tRNA-dihydrouridine synthase [Candidatus Doudnabacteria bacterium]